MILRKIYTVLLEIRDLLKHLESLSETTMMNSDLTVRRLLPGSKLEKELYSTVTKANAKTKAPQPVRSPRGLCITVQSIARKYGLTHNEVRAVLAANGVPCGVKYFKTYSPTALPRASVHVKYRDRVKEIFEASRKAKAK